MYRELASLAEYLLVQQDQAKVQVFRNAEDAGWMLSTYEGVDAIVPIQSVGISLRMSDIYAGVEFRAAASRPIRLARRREIEPFRVEQRRAKLDQNWIINVRF